MGVISMTQPLILIQARLGGTRFPGKILEPIRHDSMVNTVQARASQTGLDTRVVLAEDWPQVPQEDVLGRLWAFLQGLDGGGSPPIWDAVPDTQGKWVQIRGVFDPIIRLTADCPLLDSGQILSVLAQYRLQQVDLVSTCPAWDGLDVEVISRAALARAHALATDRRDREHVTPWIKRHGTWREIPLAGTTLRWSVDDPAGLDFVRRVFAACDHCAGGVPRHTNAGSSIGGADRHPVFDLHHLERGDLAECTAYDILKERMGGPVYVSP